MDNLIIIYGIAFVTIIYYMVQLKPMHTALETAVTADTEYPRDAVSSIVWPWSITSYSFWPSWIGHDGSSSVIEHYRKDNGKYGYTGRQDTIKQKQLFGNGYGFAGFGGNYGGGGSHYGFTGRK